MTETNQHRPEMPLAGEMAIAVIAFLSYFIVYFSRALFDDRLLAVGDAVYEYLPALITAPTWWTRDLYGGFPAFADPQALVLSPLRVVGSHYNAAVLAVYVIAASGTWGYVRWLTRSRGAGLLAALIFTSSGPMIAHFGHLTIIYSAAWLPWTMWAIAVTAQRRSVVAMTGGAFAIGLGAIAGHPQIFVYTMVVATAYAAMFVTTAPASGRFAVIARLALVIGAGIAIACVQLVPLAEIGARSLRTNFSFADFITYSLSPAELLLLVFPNLWSAGNGAYLGLWGLAELSIACGMVAVTLTIAAIVADRRMRETWFFLAVAIVALAFALGASTPLATFAFHVPGLGRFRAPARAGFESTFALATLAGIGYAQLAGGRVARSLYGRYWAGMAAFVCVVTASLGVVYPRLAERAHERGADLPAIFANHAIVGPAIALALTLGVIGWTLRRPSRIACVPLAMIVVVESGLFCWSFLIPATVPSSVVAIDPEWREFAREVSRERTRVLYLDGINTGGARVAPNQGLLYDLPTAGAYGPLVLADYATVMNVDTVGAVRSLERLDERRKLGGVGWIVSGTAAHWPVRLGGNCTPQSGKTSAIVRLPRPVRASHLEIVSNMGCSVAIEQGTQIMRVDVHDAAGNVLQDYLRAGVDTAEWAFDRPDVMSVIRHRRPAIFDNFAAGGFSGHWYRSRLALDGGRAIAVEKLDLQWLLAPGPGIAINRIALVDESTGVATAMTPDEVGIELPPDIDVGARAVSLPRAVVARRGASIGAIAWLVPEALPMTDAEAREAIRSGRLPDGREFDPYRTALLQATGAAMHFSGPEVGHVRVEDWSNGAFVVDVTSPAGGFLVLAESAYPGWHATIDDRSVPVETANVAFQGVRVPAGQHRVILRYYPRSLLLGIGIALVALIVLTFVLAMTGRLRRDNSPDLGGRPVRAMDNP